MLGDFRPVRIRSAGSGCRSRIYGRFPSVALLAYGDFAGRPACDSFRLGQAGVWEILEFERGDAPVSFRLLLTGALAGSAVGLVLNEIGDVFPEQLLPWVRQLLVSAHRPLSAADAARAYHSHPNTLRTHLHAAGLPPVNKLITWMRLFHAAHLLGDSERSAENVALMLGFPSVNALRNQLLRYVGLAPGEVRARGGLPPVLDTFRARHRNGCWKLRNEQGLQGSDP